jgi:hypothetical protein
MWPKSPTFAKQLTTTASKKRLGIKTDTSRCNQDAGAYSSIVHGVESYRSYHGAVQTGSRAGVDVENT